MKVSYHWVIIGVSLLLAVWGNTYFLSLIAPNFGIGTLILVGVFLCALFALMLELLCIRWSYKIILTLVLLISSGASYSINALHSGMTPDLIYSILTANPRETKETLNLSFLMHILVLFVIPCSAVWASKTPKVKVMRGVIEKFGLIAVYSSIIVGLWFGVIGKDITFLFKQNRPLYYVVNPISPIRSFIQYLGDQGKKNLVYTQVALDAKLISSTKPKMIVFVIGESARGMNFSLNGYVKQTNPLLSQYDHLISFQNFSSCGVITAISVPCMMTDYTRKTYTKRYLSDFRDNLLDITQRVGIKTYYLGNNGGGCIGNICIRLPKDQVKFYNDGSLDGVMLKDLDQIIQKANGNTFVVLHQMGSHGQSYYKRYPKEFKYFKPTCDTAQIQECSPESLKNTYDNSILYTDFFLNEVIQRLQEIENRFDVMLWYVSDHGESLGENGMYMHGGLPYFLAPKTQTLIPSIVWFGNGFDWGYQALKTKEKRELSQDYVFHTLLRLWGIETKDYDAKLDLTR
ncbi:phosphoethanolamine transferase [Helicobacter kayseriensis]|uniref:phosphoethanolamine transferase n=1 Tax=Helicobacter kayseriensis TaxID=2905877 RepID=UPI001E498D5D|nr:sulfatase-like hydrolase/transferase [Helicobacter kayseriensis]MCE3047022.1 sulfatase-like hydrolase/transferase [Helicobacter kayseriensis]MCE3048318.1 sulfatase-like hydrolase/transferase [Helicobacter kayseriensis]